MIIHGDCLEVMPTLEENSVDSIVTDPPYGLSFMGKDWDRGVPGVAFWQAAYRVMKPGAHLLAFGGTRTFHRLTCAIEDAGFEIRDCMMWLYGSGFPKSLDVSKAIDKAAGAERKVVGKGTHGKGSYSQGMSQESGFRPYVAGLPSENNGGVHDITAPATDAAKQWSGWGTALKPAWEPIIVARKPIEGTVAENVQKWGCGGMNIDGNRIPADFKSAVSYGKSTAAGGYAGGFGNNGDYIDPPSGRWPANVILDEEAGKMLDGQSGITKSPAGISYRHAGENRAMSGPNTERGFSPNGHGDRGGASRFFYCAKASKRERGEGNNHPTVKPLSLLQYLIKLVTPPNGIVLDPFMGSGSTLIAASHLGFKSIGIEMEKHYCEIAEKRLDDERMPLEMAVNQ